MLSIYIIQMSSLFFGEQPHATPFFSCCLCDPVHQTVHVTPRISFLRYQTYATIPRQTEHRLATVFDDVRLSFMHLVSEALLRFTVGPRTSSENVLIDELYSLASSVSSLVTWVFACKPDLTNCSSWNLGLHLCLFSRSTSPLVIAGLTVVIVRPTVLCFPEFTSPHSISRSGIRTTGIYTKE